MLQPPPELGGRLRVDGADAAAAADDRGEDEALQPREPREIGNHRILASCVSTSRHDLATVREERGNAPPRYVEEALRRFVRCGVLAHGFLRVVCPTETTEACRCSTSAIGGDALA